MFGLIENNKMSVYISALFKYILKKRYNRNIDAFVNISHFDFFIKGKTEASFEGVVQIDEAFLKNELHISSFKLNVFGIIGNWSKTKKIINEKINSLVKSKFGVEANTYISKLNKSSKNGYVFISIDANISLDNWGFVKVMNSIFADAFVIREIASNDISFSIDDDKLVFNVKSDFNIDLLHV